MSARPRITFLDLKRAAAGQRAQLEGAITRVLSSGQFILGAELAAFERELAAIAGIEHAVGVASGTDAVEISLRALGIGPGDEVITQANTCVATISAIVRGGAKPVLCDVDRISATMDPESLCAAATNRTRAVVPVHLYGQCADMVAISAVTEGLGISIVEDCAQALGARSPVAPAGSHGALGAFSFYPTKNLGALGDAGAVVTADDELAARARRLRTYGQNNSGTSTENGVNSRLDELQAAILRVRLPRLEEAMTRRRAIAAHYDAAILNTPVIPIARLPWHEPAFQLYVVRAPRRKTFIAELSRRGVQTMIHYATPVHEVPAYRSLSEGSIPLANSEALAREVVSLPLYPELSDAEVEYIADAVREAVVHR